MVSRNEDVGATWLMPLLLVVAEVVPGEGPIGSLGFVEHRHVRHPTLAVRVGFDQTGIDSKTFTTDQPFGHTTALYSLEHVPKYITATQTAMTVLGEWLNGPAHRRRGPIGRTIDRPGSDELLAQPPLRHDAKTITNDQHPDQKFRINRGPACGAVERCHMRRTPSRSTKRSIARSMWSAGTRRSSENS